MAIFASLRSRFLDRPVPETVVGIASGFVCGIRTGRRRGSVGERFILPLGRGSLVPSFDRKNLADPGELGARVAEGLDLIGVGAGTASLLIPESSVRVFVLAAESIPATQEERDSFVRWRTGKQMPLIHDDIRMDYAVSAGPGPKKIIVSMARSSIVREYEEILEGRSLKVGLVTVPSLSLVRLVAGLEEKASGVILNVEDDHLSLLALMNGGWALYRQKIIAAPGGAPGGSGAIVEQVVQEVENTVHFLEDKERQRVEKVWVRAGLLRDGHEIAAGLAKIGTVAVEELDFPGSGGFDAREKAVLAPLMGQVR